MLLPKGDTAGQNDRLRDGQTDRQSESKLMNLVFDMAIVPNSAAAATVKGAVRELPEN